MKEIRKQRKSREKVMKECPENVHFLGHLKT
jgi:hypothetical protein